MVQYICHWCGGLEIKDDPIIEDGNNFCCKQCLEKYRKSIEHKIIESVMKEEISFLDMPKWLRDKTSGRKPRRYETFGHKCVVCGNLFYSYKEDHRTCCTPECHKKRITEIAERNKIRNVGWTVHTWNGGVSYGQYCHKFNNDLKTRVRVFFENKCFLCGKTQNEEKRKLSIHHVNYDKKACCTDRPALFVPLCSSCHMKTNHDRKTWEDYFEKILKEQYNYKCYYTKEEYREIQSQECTT